MMTTLVFNELITRKLYEIHLTFTYLLSLLTTQTRSFEWYGEYVNEKLNKTHETI